MRFIDPLHDEWPPLATGADLATTAAALLSWDQWQRTRKLWSPGTRLAVMLPNTLDVESLRTDAPGWSMVALQFPKWTDGRAYSQARLLRTRLRFGGEVRATGEVLVDMLPLLQRSGFDAVQLRGDQSLDSAQRALRFFAGHYQGDTVEPRPLFARRAA